MKSETADPLASLSADELDYYRQNPEEIHELLNRETVRRKMIGWILLAAAVLVTLSKLIPFFFGDVIGEFASEVAMDLVFEMGAALMGAIATLYFVEITQAQQYEENKRLYRALKARLGDKNPEQQGEDSNG